MSLKSLGLKCNLYRKLKNISTPDFSKPMVQKFMVENLGVEAWGRKVQS
jgi:hypothetical protein